MSLFPPDPITDLVGYGPLEDKFRVGALVARQGIELIAPDMAPGQSRRSRSPEASCDAG